MENYVMHYGIKDQRWGIRRFQNEDGSYTAEGKERYSKNSTTGKRRKSILPKAHKKEERPTPESATWKSKDAKYLSDDELRRRNTRLQQEQQYKALTSSGLGKGLKSETKNLLMKVSLVPIAAVLGGAAMKIYKGKFDEFVAPILGEIVGVDLLKK